MPDWLNSEIMILSYQLSNPSSVSCPLPCLPHSLLCLTHQLIDHCTCRAKLFECFQLPVGTRAVFQNPVGIFDLISSAEFIDHIAEKPVDHFVNEFADGNLFLFSQVDQFAIEPISHGPPFIFFDQLRGVNAESHVIAAKFPQLGNDRLEYRGYADSFFNFR